MVLSVGIIPVRSQVEEWEFLLLRCFNYWDFPKGETDPGEEALAAGIRELKEETSIDRPYFHWGETFYETEVYSRGKVARYYLAQVDAKTEVKLLPNPENGIIEHHEFRWVSFNEGLKLVNPRIKKVLEWGQGKLDGKNH